ncbi:hypothetical protein L0F63_007244 [Massospora cicadina]|nr:hypothetical protein L0F63_007244 [Massospora cicadina]
MADLSGGDNAVRTAPRYDPITYNKPNRKFQLALQSLDKQHNRPRPRQDGRPQEPKPPAEPPKPKLESRPVESKLTFAHNPSPSPGSAAKISFVRNSPKPSPPATPISDSPRLGARNVSGYRASPLGQPQSPAASLSFVRSSTKPEPEKPRLPREVKDRVAVTTSAHFMRSISVLSSQHVPPAKPYSRPEERPKSPKVKPTNASLDVPQKHVSPSASSEPAQPSAAEPRVNFKRKVEVKPKPALSILDRLGTVKRDRSRSPSPLRAKDFKRERLATVQPKPQQPTGLGNGKRGRSRTPSPIRNKEYKRDKLASAQPKLPPQIASRLGPLPNHDAPRVPPPTMPPMRHRPNHSHEAPARYMPSVQNYSGYAMPVYRPPQRQPEPAYAPPAHPASTPSGYSQAYLVGRPHYSHRFVNPPYGYLKPTSQQRCQYFPRCAREDCKFFHPTKDCPNGEACQDMDCLFIHPIDKKPVMCIFDAACNRPECQYAHEHRRLTIAEPERYLPMKCKGECVGQKCPFLHGNETLPFAQTYCIFGPRCNRPPCSYLHLSTYRKNPPRRVTPLSEIMLAYQGLFEGEEF